MTKLIQKTTKYFITILLVIVTIIFLGACSNKKVTKIEITENPYKTSYYAGEYFDTSGMVLSAYYKDGSKDSIKFADNNDKNNEGYTYDKYKVPLTVNDTIINFYYGNKTISINITVTKKSVLPPKTEDIKYYVTATSITITPLLNAEYKLGENMEYRDSNVFASLDPNTTYKTSIRYKETDTTYESREIY